ncbi:MAG: hypothetical protein QOG60_384 [Frankiaceae bacterium]|nr:hypothetical protein [Frankiaceae bacterium]
MSESWNPNSPGGSGQQGGHGQPGLGGFALYKRQLKVKPMR